MIKRASSATSSVMCIKEECLQVRNGVFLAVYPPNKEISNEFNSKVDLQTYDPTPNILRGKNTIPGTSNYEFVKFSVQQNKPGP